METKSISKTTGFLGDYRYFFFHTKKIKWEEYGRLATLLRSRMRLGSEFCLSTSELKKMIFLELTTMYSFFHPCRLQIYFQYQLAGFLTVLRMWDVLAYSQFIDKNKQPMQTRIYQKKYVALKIRRDIQKIKKPGATLILA
jgi:hypothetical protein